jgi:hypothetical protein
MSGIVQNNILRSSGTIAVSAAGLNWSDTIITGSTATVEAGNGYWINTTSNTCTITLPSSAESGDQIVLIDFARTWGTNKIIIDSNGLNYQGNDDTYTVEYNTDGQSLNIVYSDATKGWLPLEDDVTALEPVAPPTQKAIFGYGYNASGGGRLSMSNLVNSSGVVAADVTGVGTARMTIAATSYGGDKAIFGYGDSGSATNLSNLVSSSGVIASDTTGVGTARYAPAAASYDGDKGIFGYGDTGGDSYVSLTNLVNNFGVIATDTTGVGTARRYLAATGYGSSGQAVFAYGSTGSRLSMKNLVSNSGVVASDATGVGSARNNLAAVKYGTDKAIFGYGSTGSITGVTNLVSNVGVVAADVSGVGTARQYLAAASYGGDKALFGYGNTASGAVSMTNLVNNSGVVGSDVTGVGSVRETLGAAGYSTSA